jgi:hypothetical protein
VGGKSGGPVLLLFSATFFDEVAFIPCGSLRIAGSQVSTQEYEACLSGGLIKHESWLFRFVLGRVMTSLLPISCGNLEN